MARYKLAPRKTGGLTPRRSPPEPPGKSRQSGWLHGFHFAPQPRHGSAAQLAKYAVVAPFAFAAARSELTVNHTAAFLKCRQGSAECGLTDAKPRGHVRRGERRVRSRIPRHEIDKGFGHALEQRGGKPHRQRRSQRIAIARGIFHRNPALLAGNRDFDDTPRTL